MSETLTEGLRRRVREQTGECPTCHQPTVDGGIRTVARDIGIPHSVLWRWLRGKDMTGRNLDLVAAWLDREEAAQ